MARVNYYQVYIAFKHGQSHGPFLTMNYSVLQLMPSTIQ